MLRVDFGEPVALNGIKIHPDGQIEFLRDDEVLTPKAAHTEVSYDRAKGPKVVSRAYTAGPRLRSHPNATLDSADRVLWIDTNSKLVEGQLIHTTCVILGEPVGHTANFTFLRYQKVHGLEFRGACERPEAFAWCEVIERFRRNPARLLHWRVAIVVDSDLRRLESINTRQEQIWGDYRLPLSFEFLYASADVRQESGLNAIMAECDRGATAIREHAVRLDPLGTALLELTLVGDRPCRTWQPQD